VWKAVTVNERRPLGDDGEPQQRQDVAATRLHGGLATTLQVTSKKDFHYFSFFSADFIDLGSGISYVDPDPEWPFSYGSTRIQDSEVYGSKINLVSPCTSADATTPLRTHLQEGASPMNVFLSNLST